MTTPFSCVLLTMQSVLHQNLTCQPSSSYCRTPMILDILKNELKPSLAADTTKGFLLHADKNGEHYVKRSCIMVIRMGNTSVWRIYMEIISTHTTSRSLGVVIRAHERLNILAFLSFASVLLDLNINPPQTMNPLQENTSSITMLGNLSTPILVSW